MDKKFYITNKEFMAELKRYHKLNKISKRLHELFYLLAQRIARKSLFYRRITEQSIKSNDFDDIYNDFIHEGYLKCIKRIDSFNIDKHDNPFSYFTSVITNTYKDFFFYEKKQEIIKSVAQNMFERAFLMKWGFKLQHDMEDD